MTLRARLLVALGALLAAALVISGALVVGLTRQSLVDQLDADLRSATDSPGPFLGGSGQDDTRGGRRFALLLYRADGTLAEALPAGLPAAPDPLPSMPEEGVDALPLRRIVQRPAESGLMSYRVLALPAQTRAGDSVTVVLAAPMTSIDQSTFVLLRTLLVVGLVVLTIMLILGWFIIRRDLRPLEQITATAEQISAGDLSRRVGVPDDGSEVGRLGHAFDAMLDQIQAAFDSQHAALVAKERSESQLRRFVADASHELRTPLTALRGYAELYRAGGLADQEALEQAMTRIGSESRRMATLVEDLLLLARLDQGRPLRHDPVKLSALVEDALQDLLAVEPQRPVTASIAPNVLVTGDEDRLRQLVGNLLTNVRVHTSPESPVEVALTEDAESASLRVTDRGPGVPAEHVEHIFDRFYRADAGRSRDHGGSGLGLSIAASVAAAHGGRISYSDTQGGGASFVVTLPRS